MTWGHEDGNLVRLHDGLLDERTARRVREHLEHCARCQELGEAIAFSRSALVSLSPVESRDDDREKARAAMLRAVTREPQLRPKSQRWLLAAAAIALVAGVGWWYRPHVRFVAGAPEPRSIESLAIAQQRSWSAGTGSVAEAIASIDLARRHVAAHTGVAPNLQNVPASGGRRLLGLTPMTIGSAPASTLIYQIDSQPVVLVVARAARLTDAPPSLLHTKRLEMRHDGDARIFTWSASGDAYSLAVPNGVSISKACAVCHEGTRMMPVIESATRRM